MRFWIVIVLLAVPPILPPLPEAIWPYAPYIRREPQVVTWLWQHPTTSAPCREMIGDPVLPVRVRQRIWQFRQKRRTP